MMRVKPLRLLCLLPLFFLAACDGVTRLQGRVLDDSGGPVKEAKIILVSRGVRDEAKTREDGSFNVLVVHAPGAAIGTLTVSKEGYDTYRLEFKSDEELGVEREIVLKRLPPATEKQK